MDKAVLISIRPKWVEKILSGEKTLELRKTRPKLETPFKVYIYCTNPKNSILWNAKSYIYADDHSHNAFDRCWNGSVVGEFICNNITEDAIGGNCDILCVNGCMGLDQIKSYGGNKKLYGWHISKLEIYDTPKQLNCFKPWKCECKYNHLGLEIPKCDGCHYCNVEKPPQSWCYVEAME